MKTWMLQIRGGVERDRYGKKAGKGALIQTDLCPSLGVSLDTTLFQEFSMEEMNATAACPINSMVLGKIPAADDRQTIGLGEEGDPLPTISTAHHHAVAMGCDAYNQSGEEEVSATLRNPEGGDNTAKVAVRMDLNFDGEVLTDHAQTIRAGASASIGGGVVLEPEPSMRYLVRRLTPLETERLMGYPEGHTIPLFGEITEELVEEFVQVFDGFAEAMGESKKPATKAQVRKWLEKISNQETCPDAPRYKACGNGWAINCARWVLQGVDSYLRKQDATISP